MLWNQVDGHLEAADSVRAVCLSANRFIEPPACSKPIQKKMENSVRMQTAMTRCHSARGQSFVVALAVLPAS